MWRTTCTCVRDLQLGEHATCSQLMKRRKSIVHCGVSAGQDLQLFWHEVRIVRKLAYIQWQTGFDVWAGAADSLPWTLKLWKTGIWYGKQLGEHHTWKERNQLCITVCQWNRTCICFGTRFVLLKKLVYLWWQTWFDTADSLNSESLENWNMI